ncbi:nuclear transport factor 2 family protein [Rhodocytophaga rosea]|uniref:Nuclear transport factor 2 family protein n=1 Tax=Rhodocytophaga rosea TaxID=2704465 RepID=A0A6C0GKC8_9BACT|nr:nuclear transport factor 2 family protein [Rhodocytophaga rosea]QHT68478.1 nuclear transport factor 2 family protein [Rhodocytophaga rosea]
MNKEIELVKKYFHLVETFHTDSQAYEEILHPNVIQTEYPNLVTPQIKSRSRDGLMNGAKAGKQLLSSQKFEIIGILAGPGHLTVELQWHGTVAVDVGPFTKEQQLMAYICTIFEFKDGKIFRQRNYDCYEPFKTGAKSAK